MEVESEIDISVSMEKPLDMPRAAAQKSGPVSMPSGGSLGGDIPCSSQEMINTVGGDIFEWGTESLSNAMILGGIGIMAASLTASTIAFLYGLATSLTGFQIGAIMTGAGTIGAITDWQLGDGINFLSNVWDSIMDFLTDLFCSSEYWENHCNDNDPDEIQSNSLNKKASLKVSLKNNLVNANTNAQANSLQTSAVSQTSAAQSATTQAATLQASTQAVSASTAAQSVTTQAATLQAAAVSTSASNVAAASLSLSLIHI